MPAIRGVLLDIDGTLVDSNDAHAHAWVDALAEMGHEVLFEKVRPLIGMGGDKLLPAAAGISEETKEGKQISKRRGEIFKEKYVPTLKATPGAQELLAHLKAKGFRLAAATSAKKEEVEPLLKVCGAERLLDGKTSSDDAEESKPDPDIVQAALKQIGLPASQVLMLGDTPYDIEAAAKAGVGVIAVRCGGWKEGDLGGALAVYENPAELLARWQGSPLAG